MDDASAWTALMFGAVVVVCARSTLRRKLAFVGVPLAVSSLVVDVELKFLRCFLRRFLRHSGFSHVVTLVTSLWKYFRPSSVV